MSRSLPDATSHTRWLIAAFIIAAVSLLGFVSPENYATHGLTVGSAGVVTAVQADSGAARAGIAIGDRVVDIDGVPWTSMGQFKARRVTAGDSRRFTVDRDGASHQFSVTYSRISASTLGTYFAAALVGLTFLFCGLSTYFRHPTSMTRLTAFLGLGGMVAFGIAPYVPHLGLRLALVLALALIGMMMLPILLEIALRFPNRPTLRTGVQVALYAPVVLVVMLMAAALLVFPGLGGALIAAATIVPAAYVLAILVTAIVRWRRSASDNDRRALARLVLGLIIGLVPMLVGAFIPSLPGASVYFLSLVALPITIVRGLRNDTGETTEPGPVAHGLSSS